MKWTWKKIKDFLYKHRLDIGIAVLIFAIAAVPRLVGLGTFLTADEKTWIGRSYEFIRAFKDLRFNDMLQTTHPGVTTLWVAGFAVTATILTKHILFTSENLSHFIIPAQFSIAFLNTLAIPFVYWLLKDITKKRWMAVTATLFIALDPLLIGYSRVVHVDALLASFMLLSMLSMIRYVQTAYSKRWLVITAVISALAILTKIPSIFLLPFFILVMLVTGVENIRQPSWYKSRLKDLAIWLAIIIVLFVTIWPAMLFVPDHIGNVLVLKRDFVIAASTPHDMTESYTLNAYHYPAALLTRTTPLVLVLVIVGLVMTIYQLWQKTTRFNQKWFTLLCWAYVFFFIIMMTLGAKKGDRYIMPVFPVLSIIAALSLDYFKRWKMWGAVAVLLSLLVPIIHYHPYEIAYSNPFLPDNLSQELGWGEGLDQVGNWLNTHSPQAYVASWYPEELAAYTSAHVAHINAHEQSRIQYVVLYRNMFGRSPEHYANNFIDEYYKKRNPIFVASIGHKEFAWVYEKMTFGSVVGELLPHQPVSQQIDVQHNQLAGIELFFATYSGRAKVGSLLVTLRNTENQQTIQEWTIPMVSIEDDKWKTFLLNQSLNVSGRKISIQIEAKDTFSNNAPTIRVSSKNQYHTGHYMFNFQPKKGDLAIRLLYRSGEKIVTEEDTRLLP